MPINWYPGHMARAKRLLADQLARVDVVIELCDARMPHASRNPDLDALCKNKRRILVLNKADLAETGPTSAWIAHFARCGVEAMPYSSTSGKAKDVFARIERATKEAVERQAARGVKKTVRVMVVGVPNVGKSTFINRLHGGAIAKTGDRPGVTRSNQWVRVTPYLELLDTPGLLWPRLDDQIAARRLCYIGTIRDQVVDHQMLAIHLLEDLLDSAPQAAIARFRLKEPCERGLALLENACRGRGWLLPGGVFDTDRGASVILDEFRAGKLGRMTLERAPRARAQEVVGETPRKKEETDDAQGSEGAPGGDHAD